MKQFIKLPSQNKKQEYINRNQIVQFSLHYDTGEQRLEIYTVTGYLRIEVSDRVTMFDLENIVDEIISGNG